MRYKSKGLTLIELLIVITIIGLLASVFAINVGKWRARARDSQRVADIRTIQQGLAFYFFRSDYSGAYPTSPSCGEAYIIGSDCLSLELLANGAMSTVPADPINDGDYKYHYTSQADGASYILIYYLETNSIQGKSQGQNFATP